MDLVLVVQLTSCLHHYNVISLCHYYLYHFIQYTGLVPFPLPLFYQFTTSPHNVVVHCMVTLPSVYIYCYSYTIITRIPHTIAAHCTIYHNSPYHCCTLYHLPQFPIPLLHIVPFTTIPHTIAAHCTIYHNSPYHCCTLYHLPQLTIPLLHIVPFTTIPHTIAAY